MLLDSVRITILQEKTILLVSELIKYRRSLATFSLSTRKVTIILRADHQNYRRTILSLGDMFHGNKQYTCGGATAALASVKGAAFLLWNAPWRYRAPWALALALLAN